MERSRDYAREREEGPMKHWANRLSLLAVAAVLLGLGACGDSDSSKDSNPPPPPPVSKTVVTNGVITGIGSVYVNGERYGTDDASVTMDDRPGDLLQLKVGQYVELKGHEHTDGAHDADIIHYHNVLEGPITRIDAGTSSLVVLGQTVRVTLDTVFGDAIVPASIEGLAVGDVVEVSGIVPADGLIDATRIDVKPDGGPYDVSGYVTGVSVAVHRFNLNALVVDYSAANMEDFTAGDPAVGNLVKVTGSTFLADGALVALHVELRSDDYLTAGPGDVLEVEGPIADFVSVTDFTVAGWDVTTSMYTTYEHGTAADLADGVLVMVKGIANADGVLVAHKIAFREVSTIRIVAQLDVMSPYGDLKLLGVDVKVTDTTVFQDMSALDLREFDFYDLAVGNWLDLRGYEDPEGSGKVVATHVVRIDPASGVRIRGPFRDPAPPSFDILSVLVTTDPYTCFIVEGGKCSDGMTAAEFFAQAEGELVEAWGTWNAPVLDPAKVEIKVSDVE
jgi:hypothetical protein